MEFVLFVITLGLLSCLNILGYRKLDRTIREIGLRNYRRVYRAEKKLQGEILDVKTRLTNSRKRDKNLLRIGKRILKYFEGKSK